MLGQKKEKNTYLNLIFKNININNYDKNNCLIYMDFYFFIDLINN